MDQKNTIVVGIFLVICILLASRITHAQNNTNLPICGSRTSCKWIYYGTDNLGKRYAKQVIINNKCTCTSTQSCVYDEENISLDLFVYRCKEDSPSLAPSSTTSIPLNQTST